MAFSKLLFLPIGCFMLLLFGTLIMGFEVFYYMILPIVGLAFLAVVSWFIPFWWFKRIPEPARTIDESKREGKPPLYVVHDTGRGKFTNIEERLGEGIVVTREGKWKILPQMAVVETPNPDAEDDEKKKVKYSYYYRDFVSKRSLCIGLDMPIWFGYSGVACLLNPLALALYEAGEMKVQTSKGKFLFNPKKKRGKRIESTLR